MANELTTTTNLKQYLASPQVQHRVKELLGKRSNNFMASVTSMVNADQNLAQCDPTSLFMACLTAAALDLPINKSLGQAHIVPFRNNKANVTEAQFILGWRGYIQLAQRSGQYNTINSGDVREGEIAKRDRLSGALTFEWCEDDDERAKLPIIGYVAYFKLVSGFEKMLYMSTKEIEDHARKYSKSYQSDLKFKSQHSLWSTDFNVMAQKTVIRLLIGKYGPMSIDMQKAFDADYGVIREDGRTDYVDVDLQDVGASNEQKQAIIEANTEPASDEALKANMDKTLHDNNPKP